MWLNIQRCYYFYPTVVIIFINLQIFADEIPPMILYPWLFYFYGYGDGYNKMLAHGMY